MRSLCVPNAEKFLRVMCGSRACLASSAVGLLLLFLLAGLSGCAALFSDEGPVPIIGENDFEIAVQQSPVPVLVVSAAWQLSLLHRRLVPQFELRNSLRLP